VKGGPGWWLVFRLSFGRGCAVHGVTDDNSQELCAVPFLCACLFLFFVVGYLFLSGFLVLVDPEVGWFRPACSSSAWTQTRASGASGL